MKAPLISIFLNKSVVVLGYSHKLKVVAQGKDLKYSWFESKGYGWKTIVGETKDTLTLPSKSSQRGMQIRVAVQSVGGTTYSGVCTLDVLPALLVEAPLKPVVEPLVMEPEEVPEPVKVVEKEEEAPAPEPVERPKRTRKTKKAAE